MDSMRHLSTSLPTTSRRNRTAAHSQQPQQLLSDFKAAALSVTNLYKTAAAENTWAREQGYQDALDDLLAFLDTKNMGLMDGEGWRVRQWATERLDDAPRGSDEEDEAAPEVAEGTRSSSPEVQRKPPMPATTSESTEDSTQRRASEPPQQQALQVQPPPAVPSLEDFAFRSTATYPTNHAREDGNANGMDLDSQTASTATAAPGTVRITPRTSRSKHTSHPRNRDNRSTGAPTFNFNLSAGGAGSKRKIPYPDFFDISGMNFDGQNRGEKKDGDGRGGKRGRHV